MLIEVINEPEWCMSDMSDACKTTQCVKHVEMQRFVAMIAEAVHKHSSLKVTVGSASLKWDSTAPYASAQYWSDKALKEAYPSDLGTLDLYNVHFWNWMERADGFSPCQADASYWELDKPVVFGEFPDHTHGATTREIMRCLYENGFAGGMFWAYNDNGTPLVDAPTVRAPFACFACRV